MAGAVRTERFQEWKLTPAGMIVGQWPISAEVEPDQFTELDIDETSGRVVAVREWLEGHSQPLQRKPSYDGVGRLCSSEYVDPTSNIQGRNFYEYDERGLLRKRQELDENGKRRFYTTTVCDEAGRFVEETTHSGDGVVREKHLYAYDASDNLIRDTRFDGPDTTRAAGHSELAYDSRGRLIRRAWHDATGKEQSVFSYRYDDLDRAVEWRVERGDSVVVAQVKFDARGKKLCAEYVDDKGKPLVMERPSASGASWRKSMLEPAPADDSTAELHWEERQVRAATIVAYHLYETGDYEKAAMIFEMAVRAAPDDVYLCCGAAACALKLRQPQTALNWYERALAINPNDAQSQRGHRHVVGLLGQQPVAEA